MDNEKLNAFLAAARETARRAGTLAADAAYGLGLAAEKQAAAARRWMRSASVEGRMDGKLMEVGELIYATHTGTPADSDVLDGKLREVDELAEELKELRGSGRRAHICPLCGGKVRRGDRFCRSCGGKL